MTLQTCFDADPNVSSLGVSFFYLAGLVLILMVVLLLCFCEVFSIYLIIHKAYNNNQQLDFISLNNRLHR